MAKFNTDYLKFDALSIKDAITKKLVQNSDFTDQLFEGSNLSILIDTFSYMFEVLTYYINHSASEAIFSDSELYENLNRIVKMIGYNPTGYIPAKILLSIFDKNELSSGRTSSRILPKYSFINTGSSDKNGNPVFYSTTKTSIIDQTMSHNDTNRVEMVNGKWKIYNKTFTSDGQPSQSFTLDLLNMTDANNPLYIGHPYIDVYVKRQNTFIYFSPVPNSTLFGKSGNLIGPQDHTFELRLNENKQYNLIFGDGIHGSKLQSGDELYIVYLETNYLDGKIGADIINDSKIDWGIGGLDLTTFYKILNITSTDVLQNQVEKDTLIFNNALPSTIPEDLENNESIKKNAPNLSRMGGKLVTTLDYKQFILSAFKSDLYDVNIMNNFKYMAEFQGWLYQINKNLLSIELKNIFFNYADSCDFNNIYVWIKSKYDSLDKKIIENELFPRKHITAEPIIINALDTYFVPCLVDNTYDITDWDPSFENWIEVLKDKNSSVNADKIKNTVILEIRKFFNPIYNTIGSSINLDKLYTNLMNIDGVKTIQTAYKKVGDPVNKVQYYNSISFIKWTKTIVKGQDKEIIKGNIKLKGFQFPVLQDDLDTRVKVVVETFSQTSIEY